MRFRNYVTIALFIAFLAAGCTATKTAGSSSPSSGVSQETSTAVPDDRMEAITTVRKMYGRSMRAFIDAYVASSGSENHETGWQAHSTGHDGIWRVSYPFGETDHFDFEYNANNKAVRYLSILPLDCDGCAVSPDPLQP